MNGLIRTIALLSMLICSFCNIQGQQNSKIDWKLDKVVWSQAQHDSTKPGKPVIDFDIIENWRGLGKNLTISSDGRYIAYDSYRGNSFGTKVVETVIRSSNNLLELQLHRTESDFGFFSSDSKQFIFQDKEGLCFLKLDENDRKYVYDIESYKAPIEQRRGFFNAGADWIAYVKKNKELTLQNLSTGEQKKFSNIISYNFCKLSGSSNNIFSDKWFSCQTSGKSPELIICDLTSGKDYRFPIPNSFIFSVEGKKLMLSKGNSLVLVNLTSGSRTTLWSSQNSKDNIEVPSFDNAGKQVVFNVSEESGNSIWIWKEGMASAKKIADQTSIKSDAGFSLRSGVSFSENGKYLTFSLGRPEEKYEVSNGALEFTLWSSSDQLLQTSQVLQKDKVTVLAGYINAQNGEVLYIEKADERATLNGDALLITKGKWLPHSPFPESDRFWEPDIQIQSKIIKSLKSGMNCLLGRFNEDPFKYFFISPQSNYGAYYDYNQQNYCSVNLNTSKINNLCEGLKPGYFGMRLYAYPGFAKSKNTYHPAGWIEDESGFLVYDDNDVWLLDPTGKPPVNLTEGYGRKNNISFRVEGKNRDYNVFKKNERLLLKAFNVRTKENGFFSLTLGDRNSLVKLEMGPYFINVRSGEAAQIDGGQAPLKAANANVWVVKRHSPETGANYYITRDLKSYQPLTSIRPDIDVNWYTRELHHFKCLDGSEGEGILYKPENFDPKKKYPVVIPYYQRASDNLFVYQDPELARNPANFINSPAWFVSRGYLVFAPSIKLVDFVFGPACFSMTEGAAKYLNSLPYVDRGKIAAMTHSRSSKLGAYQFTHSKLIKAMWINEGYAFGDLINTAFAPEDETRNKNYGSEMQAVEEGGYGELWSNKKTWLDQTTVLNVDKAEMPLMLSCNNDDLKDNTYASQSFEIFTALRRLNKSVWWFRNISDPTGHNFFGNQSYDITIRMTQFFDHFLKKAPAPRWMTKGIPNKLVGIETRHELDATGNCAVPGGEQHCYVCEAWNKQYKRSPLMFEKEIGEWKLDKDIEQEMNKKLTAERLEREKGSEQINREVVKMLNDAMKKVEMEEKKQNLKNQTLNQKNSK